jgi:hypothetical protein
MSSEYRNIPLTFYIKPYIGEKLLPYDKIFCFDISDGVDVVLPLNGYGEIKVLQDEFVDHWAVDANGGCWYAEGSCYLIHCTKEHLLQQIEQNRKETQEHIDEYVTGINKALEI